MQFRKMLQLIKAKIIFTLNLKKPQEVQSFLMPINNSNVDLEEIEKFTISHYENNAESFRVGTKDHDVSQNIAAFLGALPKEKKLDILDFGCGPGRDVNVFKEMGHRPTGLDGSKEFCKMTQQLSKCPILHQ